MRWFSFRNASRRSQRRADARRGARGGMRCSAGSSATTPLMKRLDRAPIRPQASSRNVGLRQPRRGGDVSRAGHPPQNLGGGRASAPGHAPGRTRLDDGACPADDPDRDQEPERKSARPRCQTAKELRARDRGQRVRFQPSESSQRTLPVDRSYTAPTTFRSPDATSPERTSLRLVMSSTVSRTFSSMTRFTYPVSFDVRPP